MNTHGPVVCGYDGSPGAQDALTWAAGEVRLRDAVLQVVTAVELGTPAVTPGVPLIYWPEGDAAVVEAKRAVERAAAEMECRTEVLAAIDAPTGLLRSLSSDAALVVVGSRGVGGFSRLLLGSVSEAVAEHADCPVVVVRPHGPVSGCPYPAAVVVGVDGSPNSAAAARFAFELADRREQQLVAVHVPSNAPVVTDDTADGLPHEVVEPTASDIATVGETVRAGADAHPAVAVRTVVWGGHAVEALATASVGAAMLVVGRRGRSNLTAALLGSVSRGVLRHATCPVAVVTGGS